MKRVPRTIAAAVLLGLGPRCHQPEPLRIASARSSGRVTPPNPG